MLALVGLMAACSSDDEPERGLDAIGTPEFAPADDASTSTAPAAVEGGPGTTSPTTVAPGQGSAETSTTAAGGGGDSAPERLEVSFDDPVGDGVGGLDSSPPAWADLAGATLQRQGNAYRLTVRLGGDVPETQPGAATMNVASFFDVDGDGGIDHELWVNLGEGGWGPVFYEGDRAYPGEASNVTVVVEGRELRLLFPDVMLDAPASLRFSLASEYGELSAISSDFAHRDDAPDGDQAVAFP
ncbi:MAG TPA: hypothetical protein VFV42_00400 [Acidimicrobiales bacterium]|nr:hypothetical protein [Acidimicrobiales bacterium]